jgi:nitroimidazol reductase NimA-like FMN-containing flavoprotein (pyridoxamine 5'-phosphate oxidase superfamily)
MPIPAADPTRTGAPSDRTKVHRHPERADYGRTTVEAILDEALICHVAWVDGGEPRMIPTIHVRAGDTLYLHGSSKNRTLAALSEGAEVCVCATIVDGIVLARSAFKSSMNYRSAIVFGHARVVDAVEELELVARALTEHVALGRSADARMPTDEEFRQTSIVAVALNESSAKVRTGPPKDEGADLGLPIWAGVVPISLAGGEPEPDEWVPEGIEAPAYASAYRRRGSAGAPGG